MFWFKMTFKYSVILQERVDIEERLVDETQLHGLDWNESMKLKWKWNSNSNEMKNEINTNVVQKI